LDTVARSQAGTTPCSNLTADGTMLSAASSQHKPSPRAGVGLKLRSPVDGGPCPQQTVTTRQSTTPERLPAYGSSVSDRRSFPPDGSGTTERHSGGGGLSRPVVTTTSAASAATQVTFQDPIESKSCIIISYTYSSKYSFYCETH